MEIVDLLKYLFTTYGAPALPWSVVAFMWWMMMKERQGKSELPPGYQQIIDDYHEATLENTRVIQQLATLIEERTRRQSR